MNDTPRARRNPPFSGMTVRRAVVVAVLLGVLLPALVGGAYLARVLYQTTLTTEVARELKQQANVVALGVRESMWALDSDTAATLVEAIMGNESLVRVEILDPQHGHFVDREMPARRVGHLYTTEQAVLYRGENIGTVRLELSDAPLRAQLARQLSLLISMLVLQVASSVILILVVLQQRLGQPLHRLSAEAARLAKGELDTPIQPHRQDEIGEVESQLEITRQALQGTLRSLEQKNLALEVDLRERMRVEAQLRDREQRLRALVDQSPIAVIEFDLGWHVLDWNESARAIFGLRREEALGRHVASLFPVGEAVPFNEPDLLDEIGHRSLRRICRNQRGDDQLITCQWRISLIRDAAGQPQRSVCLVEDITERQRSEDEIRRLATVVRLTNHMVVLTDRDAYVEWFNEAFVQRTRFEPEEVRGASLVALLTGSELATEGIDVLTTALRGGESLRVLELACRTRDGERYYVQAEVQPLRGDDGLVRQCIVLLNDITARRRMSDALRSVARTGVSHEAAEFFRQLLAAIGRGARAACAYIATHRAESSDADVIACWFGDARPLVPGRVPKAGSLAALIERKGAVLVSHDAQSVLADNRLLVGPDDMGAVVAVPMHDDAGRIVGHLALAFREALPNAFEAQSLAELGAVRAGAELARLEAQEALRNSEQKFSSIFLHSPIPLVLLRMSDRSYIDVNPAALDAFGFTREAVLGRTLDDIDIYENVEDRHRMREMLDWDGFVDGADLRLRTREGTVLDSQVYVRRVVTTEPCLLIAVVDVTEQRAAQRQVEQFNATLEQRVEDRTRALEDANHELATTLERLQRTQDELIRSEKLAALGSLVAGVAHELNTPIGNSLMVASTLRDQNVDFRRQMQSGLRRSDLDRFVGEADAASEILVRNLQRAGELISSFKQVAVDQTSSQRREFDLSDVVHEIVLTLQPVFRKTPYVVDIDVPHGIVMNSFPGPLGQVLTNLINNAIIHAFEGRATGRVHISAETRGEDFVLLRCADDGNGIPPANLRKIFDPFFTTRLGREGSGLGLNIVHNIVTAVLGGEVGVESEVGEGSSFNLTLPRVAPGASQPEQDAAK